MLLPADFSTQSSNPQLMERCMAEVVAPVLQKNMPNATATIPNAWQKYIRANAHPAPSGGANFTISMGSAGSNVDITVTSNQHCVYDQVQSSRALFFDLKTRRAMAVSPFHAKLVDFVKAHNILSFNPDIQGGLKRLSYRFSKETEPNQTGPKVAQQFIAEYFLDKASVVDMTNIVLRILQLQYPHTTLHTGQFGKFWLCFVDYLEALCEPAFCENGQTLSVSERTLSSGFQTPVASECGFSVPIRILSTQVANNQIPTSKIKQALFWTTCWYGVKTHRCRSSGNNLKPSSRTTALFPRIPACTVPVAKKGKTMRELRVFFRKSPKEFLCASTSMLLW
ncbi:MAG: hypothetical protein HC848_04870 [Limnobacter sp.]|nr:hypothetical protein [Limnobacter sp.]